MLFYYFYIVHQLEMSNFISDSEERIVSDS